MNTIELALTVTFGVINIMFMGVVIACALIDAGVL